MSRGTGERSATLHEANKLLGMVQDYTFRLSTDAGRALAAEVAALCPLSIETRQARVMFEVDACPGHQAEPTCQSSMCKEEQGDLPSRALCYAHHCHLCASLLYQAAARHAGAR